MKCVHDAWQAHESELLRFIRSRIGNPDEARDLLQEIFLRALRQPNGLCDVGNPRAWLFQVTRHLLIDRYRLGKDEVSLDEELAAPAPTAPTPVDALADCLPRVLAELSAEDREAITRCDIEGLTQQAYATLHGLSLPAAKARVQRARKRLRARLVSACQVRFDENDQVCCFVPRPPPAP